RPSEPDPAVEPRSDPVAAPSGPAGEEPDRWWNFPAAGLGYAGLGLAYPGRAGPACSGRPDRIEPGLSGPASSGPALANSGLSSARACPGVRQAPAPHPACLRAGSAAPWVHAAALGVHAAALALSWTRAAPGRAAGTDFACPAPGRHAALGPRGLARGPLPPTRRVPSARRSGRRRRPFRLYPAPTRWLLLPATQLC